MSLQDLATIGATLVAGIYPITESIKNQLKNLNEKKYPQVGYFIIGMLIAIFNTFLLKNSNLFDFHMLKDLNSVDTLLLGTYVGLVATGGKDIASYFVKGRELGNTLKEQLSKLSADEVAEVAFDVLQDKGVVFNEDLDNMKGQEANSSPETEQEG